MRTRLSFPLLAAAAVAFAPADGRGSAGDGLFAEMPADLDAYGWRNRPVLVFAPSANDAAYLEQRAALEAAAEGLAERDVVVLVDTDPEAGRALRERLAPGGFEVLLVGKDGGVKLRQGRPVTTEALFAAIDAMPMRRREMEE